MFGDELSILGVYGLIVALTLVAQATGAMGRLGMGYMMSSRDEPATLGRYTSRLDRALANSVVAMALFAPAVLIVVLQDRTGAGSLLACQAFLIARAVYIPAYVAGVPGLRTLAWLAGFAATILLYFLGIGG